jgi:hypothetical protein
MRKLIVLGGALVVLSLCIPPAFANWFGDGSDEDVTISSDTYLTVQNKNGPYDGDMVVKNYNSLTIEAGATLTTDQPCRGLLIYVKNNAVINGTLSMTARGAYTPNIMNEVSATGLRYAVLMQGETDTLAAADFSGAGISAQIAVANQPGIEGNGKIFVIQRVGAAGGAAGNEGAGGSGANGAAGQSGGGGGGAAGIAYDHYGGAGAVGTCFSGGSGGGGNYSDVYDKNSQDGLAYGGKGGNDNGSPNATAGAGNPAGSGGGGANGTGGLLILVVGGDLTIGTTGAIVANGTGTSSGGYLNGGGSGGGPILIFHAGTLTNGGSISAAGGTQAGGSEPSGGKGGDGSVQIAQIDAAPPPQNPTSHEGGVDDQTVLMIHSDTTNGDTTFTDSSSSAHSITPSGNVHHSAAEARFGSTSISFDGIGDFLSIPFNENFSFGSGDFTIDTWIRFNDVSGTRAICGQYTPPGEQKYFSLEYNGGSNRLTFYNYGDDAYKVYLYTNWTPSINTWYHIALARSGDTYHLFINGVSQSLTLGSGSYSNILADVAADLTIGSSMTASYLNGYIDEFRVSKGIARWTAGFEPPSSPYTQNVDNDSDGLLDDWEILYFGNLDQESGGDFDNDKVSNLIEYQNSTDPNSAADNDIDGIPDDWEKRYFDNYDQVSNGDYDEDGYTNIEEYQLGSNPTDAQDPSGSSGVWKLNPQGIYYNSGNVGIKTSTPQSELAVNGTITAKEVIVTDTGWADFVFDDNYKLPSLDNLESYIKQNGHLPDVPSKHQIKEEGFAISEILIKQMQKIEELTLYIIELKNENKTLTKRMEQIESITRKEQLE